MASVSAFFKENRKEDKHVKVAVSKKFVDKNGDPLLWEIRPISAEEESQIQAKSRKEERDNQGKKYYIPDDNAYIVALSAQAVVEPDLGDKDLQASYGVYNSKSKLLRKMLSVGELLSLARKVTEISGLTEDTLTEFESDYEEIKN